MRNFFIALASACLMSLAAAHHAVAQASREDLLKSLNYQHGQVTLSDGLATLKLAPNFVYLSPQDTETFLTRVWENPPTIGVRTLGMILPTNANPLSPEGWAVVIKYNDSGYVSDEDAEKIDYAALLRDMQESVAEQSKDRVAHGYEKYELLGWARPPYYDKAAKKLYWAKRLRFGDQDAETLNYEVRILGRRGVLDLNAIASMSSLAQIDRSAPDLLSMVSFNQGNLYSEFNPSIDKAAAYGLAGLIAGGILTKTGVFSGLLAMLLAFKKLVAVAVFGGIAALRGRLKSIFRPKSSSV